MTDLERLNAEIARVDAEREALINLLVRKGDDREQWTDGGVWTDHTGYCQHATREAAVEAVLKAARERVAQGQSG